MRSALSLSIVLLGVVAAAAAPFSVAQDDSTSITPPPLTRTDLSTQNRNLVWRNCVNGVTNPDWRNVSSSNMLVSAWHGKEPGGTQCDLRAEINGVGQARDVDLSGAGAAWCSISFIVPPGERFRITHPAGGVPDDVQVCLSMWGAQPPGP